MKNRFVLLLGTNVGDKLQNLRDAKRAIASSLGDITTSSKIYETEPWGGIDQPVFFNQVLILQSELLPITLLDQLLDIEHRFGRVRKKKWDSRILDIDILYFNSTIIETDRLVIPHPALHKRRFTLAPLCEIDPDYIHPVLLEKNMDLLAKCDDLLSVKAIEAV